MIYRMVVIVLQAGNLGTVFSIDCRNNIADEVWRFTDSPTVIMHGPTRSCLSVSAGRMLSINHSLNATAYVDLLLFDDVPCASCFQMASSLAPFLFMVISWVGVVAVIVKTTEI